MTEPQILKRHEPLIRIMRRGEMPAGRVALLAALSLVMGILGGALFILLLGYNPIEVYAAIVKGAFRSKLAIQGTVKIAIPLLITSLGVAVAFRMKFWNNGAINGQGWIAVALVIFASWSPAKAILGSLVFGGFSVLDMYIPQDLLPGAFYKMLPFLVTAVVLIISSMRKSKKHAQPASCGINYFREER